MANDVAQPYTGPLTLDLTALAGILIDLVPGALRGCRREQDGFDEVDEELKKSVPAVGAAAGIPQDVYAHFLLCTDRITKLRAVKGVILKLAEVVEESEARYEHERETALGIILDSVRSAARRKDASLLALFEKALKYSAQAAMKGVRTRRKNAEAQAAERTPSSAPPTTRPA
jgi:hypothetical protein